MFTFPVTAASDFVRNNLEVQFSLANKMIGSMMDTSMQLGRLNIQASRKLMEESATATEKAIGLRSFADTQAFLLEQSQLAFQRFSGYSQNAQKIATGSIGNLNTAVAVTNSQQETAAVEAPVQEKHGASHGQQHEVDPQPSALVEKLISNVAGDTGNLH
ncbi:MAG TPA: phasin family protein [Noviherbaspirillum sp.]|uniref:phasin family protein n=1 Tax=Noviherbaspirillum sp. TaxID=1926288 RepID=UPI002DDD63CB|nr:phasin family protein [Noviherbaspirillum sp.]HEV2609828.1 phasin family protein [Noviherbaspirillum sp.]